MKSTIKNTVSEVYQLNDNGELSEKTKNILGMNFNSNNNSNSNNRNNSKNKNNSNNRNNSKNKNNSNNTKNILNRNNKNDIFNSENGETLNFNDNTNNNIFSHGENYLNNFKNNGNTPINNVFTFLNILTFIFFLLFIVIIGAIIYFQKSIMEYIQNVLCKTNNDKINNIEIKVGEKDKQNEELIKKLNKMEQSINNMNNKNTVQNKNNTPSNTNASSNMDYSTYDKSQQVNTDGFCYVGYEKGQRECVAVQSGDICLSGEIFPRLDKCMVPELRV